MQALLDHQVSQEPQATLDLKERREIVERASLAPGDPQVLLDPQDQDPDLLLWTWKVPGSLMWNLFGDCLAYLGHQVLPVPLVHLVLLQKAQQ